MQKKLTSVGAQCHCILLGIRILNLSQNGVSKASIQTHWKLGFETLIDQVEITEKTLQFTNILSII